MRKRKVHKVCSKAGLSQEGNQESFEASFAFPDSSPLLGVGWGVEGYSCRNNTHVDAGIRI